MEVISDQTLGQDCREEITPSEVLCSFSGLSRVRLFATPWTIARQTLLWDFAGKNTGVDCHFLLQGIFPTQGLNPYLLRCRRTLNCWVTGEAQGIPPTLKFPEATHIGHCETMKT